MRKLARQGDLQTDGEAWLIRGWMCSCPPRFRPNRGDEMGLLPACGLVFLRPLSRDSVLLASRPRRPALRTPVSFREGTFSRRLPASRPGAHPGAGHEGQPGLHMCARSPPPDARSSFAGRTLRLTRPRGRDRGGFLQRSEKVRTHPHTSTHHHRHSMPAARSARSPVMYWSLSCGTLCPYLAPRRLSWAASAGPIYCASHPLATV